MCALAVDPKNTAIAPTGTRAISNANWEGNDAATTSAIPSNAAEAMTTSRRRARAHRREERADHRADSEDRHQEPGQPGTALERLATP